MDSFITWAVESADVLGLIAGCLVAYLLGGKAAVRKLANKIRSIPTPEPVDPDDTRTPVETPLGKQLSRKCVNCKHFSKKVFEREVLQKNPVFLEVSKWRRPSQIAGKEEEEDPSVSLREDTWDAFGVCTNLDSPNRHVGVHQSDTCEAFEAEVG